MKGKRNVKEILLYTILIGYGFVTLMPFVWALSASFKPLSEILKGGMHIIPESPTLDNYKFLFHVSPYFPRWVWNSFFVSLTTTVLNVIFNTMAGYALARLRFRGKKIIFNTILAVIMVPAQITMIPNYLIMKALGILDTYRALIFPSMVNATYIFMMRQFFINFAKDVEEAAAIDGLNRIQTFFRIVFPLAKPAIATQSVFIFLGMWNEFMKPLLYINSQELFTITQGLNSFKGQYATYWNYIMAASIVSILPIILLYILLNKYFMHGIQFKGDK